MPLTFITGLLGMNVKGIPAADHPHAFIIICSITIGLALLQGAIFKWKKWF
jgi:zinc transporter